MMTRFLAGCSDNPVVITKILLPRPPISGGFGQASASGGESQAELSLLKGG